MYEPSIPAGRHRARAVEGKLTEAKTGTLQVYVRFELLDMPGKSISWYGFLSEKAEPYTVEALRTAGWSCDDISRLDGLGDREVELVIEWEDYNGNLRPRVRYINALGGGGGKSLADDKQASVVERIKKKYGRKPSERQVPLPVANDDIPF